MIQEIREYAQCFKNGQRNGGVKGLCGRIIRGRKQADFETLTDDPLRKLVMLMGPDGLESLLGKSGYEMLVEIGYEPDYIVRKVTEGNQFKLVIFKEGGAARIATWDNVCLAVAQTYPDVAYKVGNLLDFLKRVSFESIEQVAGFDFSEVDKSGPQDPRFMTHERFQLSSGNIIDVRAFLYFTVHLRELFAGDGYTYTSDGLRGLTEYIVPHRPIATLGENALLDISVLLP